MVFSLDPENRSPAVGSNDRALELGSSAVGGFTVVGDGRVGGETVGSASGFGESEKGSALAEAGGPFGEAIDLPAAFESIFGCGVTNDGFSWTGFVVGPTMTGGGAVFGAGAGM